MANDNAKRGGARRNAGRRATGRAAPCGVTVFVDRASRDRLDAIVARRGWKLSEFLRAAICAALDKEETENR